MKELTLSEIVYWACQRTFNRLDHQGLLDVDGWSTAITREFVQLMETPNGQLTERLSTDHQA